MVYSSASRVAVQPVAVERDADAGPRRQVHLEFLETQRLRHQIVGENLGAKMLAAPAEFAQAGEDLQMCSGADQALEQTPAVEADTGRLGHRCNLAGVQQAAVLD